MQALPRHAALPPPLALDVFTLGGPGAGIGLDGAVEIGSGLVDGALSPINEFIRFTGGQFVDRIEIVDLALVHIAADGQAHVLIQYEVHRTVGDVNSQKTLEEASQFPQVVLDQQGGALHAAHRQDRSFDTT